MVRVTLKYTKFHFARDDVKPGMFAMKVIVESYISEVAGSRANQPFGRIQVPRYGSMCRLASIFDDM